LCKEKLSSFPSDAYDVEQLTIAWGGPVEKNPEILFPDMRLRKIVPRIRNDSYATGKD
jgi:hypothetical protein